ncbi:uncharacterized protein BP5553_08795 [Venustampulla echinocandica]|uniref:Uncharacterized protein n=1 Tax=Venustampulla echinocandica TaxID=2656787 RepID=A0A370TF94_9HELO|nr:uncharacterized protein BP5553_08795 [Venustampulla echinocandica]RDL33356.1 hypothetical protein BP5553_08795 [Venustampulla echinocandica]
MPPLNGFSDNPLRTREQVVQAAKAIIQPLSAYTSSGHSRVKLPVSSGTLYDENAAQLEGFARPLWVVGALLRCREPEEELTANLIAGLSNGTDPNHDEYWGDVGDMDQRMVEAETISFTLLASPRDLLWDRLGEQARSNIARWFSQLNGKDLPKVNWLWFRVFTNLVLIRMCDLDTAEIRSQIKIDLEHLDTFYLRDGWSSDGLWRSPELDDKEWELFKETGTVHSIKPDRCADYYSGSFAIQFSQLLYVRVAGDLDAERTERYRQQARDFGAQIWRYFDAKGAVIPFGRSLTYRFACGAFFAALALAKVPDLPSPLDSAGAVKGFLLRHLRWNMYLTEDYNSPQSVYWAMKTFVAIGLPSTDPFWTDPETDYPEAPLSSVSLCRASRQIICNREGRHHFLLSPAQFTSLQWKGGQAKYCKFAYSSAFGFSVPTGQVSLQQLALDNALALSRDGKQTWATKWKCREPTFGTCRVLGAVLEELPVAMVVWYPWEDRSITVNTTLIPPSARWPDWHTRVHRIKINDRRISILHLVEGGFAIQAPRRRSGVISPGLSRLPVFGSHKSASDEEFFMETSDATLVVSEAGASGLCVEVQHERGTATVSAFQPEANTNLIAPRTLIPLAEHSVRRLEPSEELLVVSNIFAIPTQISQGRWKHGELADRWEDRPVVQRHSVDRAGSSDYIALSD